MDDEKVILKLTCATCDNSDCSKGHTYAPLDSLMGCTRQIPEELYDQYIHYMNEVVPFWHLYKESYVNTSYNEVYNFLQKIYKEYPIVKLIDKKGKVVER